jgi:transcriptional regulator with XRE-family HTH domain
MSARTARPQSPLGKHLTRARQAKNLSRGEVARQLGITEQAVGAWERGDRVPDSGHLARLSKLYGLNDSDVAKALRLSTLPRPAAA